MALTWRARTTLLVAAGSIAGLIAVGYGLSSALTGGDVPRGVRVTWSGGAVDVGGTSPAEARARLSRELAAASTRPVGLRVEDRSLSLSPGRAGLRLDVEASARAARSAGALDRLRALVGLSRDVPVRTGVDEPALRRELQRVVGPGARPARAAAIRYQALTPVAVPARPGRAVDLEAGAAAVRAAYLHSSAPVGVRVRDEPVRTSAAQLQTALADLARPAVAAPVALAVGGRNLVLRPADLAAALTFTADERGALQPRLDGDLLLDAVRPNLERIADPPVDATFRIVHGRPVVVPGRDGRTVRPATLAATVLPLLSRPAPRRGEVALELSAPRVTTARARTLGVRERISSFTTHHPCCAPRVTNIHAIADLLDGYVVLPGETFSLNGVVGRRDSARGFVKAPQILRGQFVPDVGGGVSQFATTLFNAVFFAGLQDVQHQPHSYYISRYPPGRESTVSYPQPDFRFRDDAPTGVLVKASYTGTSVTVTFWGTKRYDVTARTGPRTRPRPFGPQYVTRADCTSSVGADGFDIVVTRVLSQGGRQVRQQKFLTRYLPEPRFVCGSPPTAAAKPPPAPTASSKPTRAASPSARSTPTRSSRPSPSASRRPTVRPTPTPTGR